jgi:hypothetical protein
MRRLDPRFMSAFRLDVTFGTLTLIGLGATLLVQGGWQAAAAAFAILNAVGFTLAFAVLGARSERPRGLAAEAAPRHVAAPEPAMSQPQPSDRRPLPATRPRTVH